MQTKYKELIEELDAGFIDQKHFLDMLYNHCGPFKVQKHIQGENPTGWHDWLEAREWTFCNDFNHRNICACEIVFDVDLPGWLEPEERKQLLNMTLRRLNKHYKIYPLIMDTGKGYHLHYFDMELASAMIKEQNPSAYKQRYAQAILADVRTDMLKWNDKTMIAIECSKHWKRGNKISLITL
jgi:hypothetical protein